MSIVEGALVAASDEMFQVVRQTSYSPIIYEVLDYATGITDANGRLVVQGNGVTGFLGSLSSGVQAVLQKYTDIGPGDVFIVNDPYTAGGSHLSDVTVVRPFFHNGTLLGFGASKAHWTEIGGAKPGSWSNDAADVYAEGLYIPLMKIVDRGVVNETLMALIAANVRTPVYTLGDLQSQLGALVIGERRVAEAAAKYGTETVLEAMASILDRGRKAALRALRRLPKGTYFAEDYLDSDGATDQPVYVCVKVTIDDDTFTADFTGSSPSVASTINATWPSLECGVRTTFRALIDSEEPTSDGMFAPLSIICPPGTVFTAQPPTPVSTYWEASDMAADLVQKALAPHIPELMPAGHSLSVCGSILAFERDPQSPTVGLPILVEPQAGGWGGSEGQDGESALVPIGDGDTCSIPVEVLEATYPVRVLEYALNIVPGGGAGKYRGGFGLIRRLQLLQPATLTASFGRHRFPAWGSHDGGNGTPNYVEVHAADGRPLGRFGRVNGMRLEAGSVVALVTGCGGGYGDPKLRDPARVQEDLANGFLTPEDARRIYGYPADAAQGRESVDDENRN